MTPLTIALVLVNGLVVYSWLFFPVLLEIVRRARHPRREASQPAPRIETPQVAFVLSAYNEEAHIGDRIRNIQSLNYPAGHVRAYIGIDGSRDRTADEAFAAAEGDPRIAIFDFAENRGKVAVLKELVARASAAEILIFTDANTVFDRDALLHLTRHFADPAVGGVCGKLIYLTDRGGETEENVYWRRENWLKARESEVDSCLGANGAIYAIRTFLFWKEIPTNTIIDDYVLGMKVRERHYRLVYEPAAHATEVLSPRMSEEWKRRVRIGAGDFQAFIFTAPCLSPSYGIFCWMHWSHKVLRWFTPHLLLLGFLLSTAAVLISGGFLDVVFLAAYAGFGLAAFTGRLFRTWRVRGMKPFHIAEYFLLIQCAIFAGFLRFCRGNLEGRWQRSARV